MGNRAARYHAYHDSLTQVLTASAFYELASELINGGSDRKWTMVTSNIRNFRLVNTLFGVLRGNEVLVQTAQMLQSYAEDAGGLCGRLGGDQFAALVPTSRYQEDVLVSIAQDLAQEFSNGAYTMCIHFGVYHVEDLEVPVSVMCGRANRHGGARRSA